MPAVADTKVRASWAMNAELHEPGRACSGTGSYKHLDSADVPWVGGRLGERGRMRACVCVRVPSVCVCRVCVCAECACVGEHVCVRVRVRVSSSQDVG
jgi:hypothetical protein